MRDVGRRDQEIPVRGQRVEVLIRRQSLRVDFEGIRDGARDRHRHSSRLETLAGAHKQRIVEMRSQILEVTTESRLRKGKGFGHLSHALESQQRPENRLMEEIKQKTASAEHGGIGGDPPPPRKLPK